MQNIMIPAPFLGRKKIKIDVPEITQDNVLDVLGKVISDVEFNAAQINYLYHYYLGLTPIEDKVKEVRETINNKIVENRANEIVSFKTGYLFGEPVMYIRHGDNDIESDKISTLNDYMFYAGKDTEDKEVAKWMHICGVGVRYISQGDERTPFRIETLDPRNAFNIYATDIHETKLAGVWRVKNPYNTLQQIYYVYTPTQFFEIVDCVKVNRVSGNVLGAIPIIEYELNAERQGAFEIVLPILDAINKIQSNRVDDIEQTVNSFLALIGANISDETYEKLAQYKMLMLPEGTDAKYLYVQMMQSDIQTLVDNLYQNVLTICGMPNRNGGSSTSDTGVAVQRRDGWENAEARAKDTESSFKKSDRYFLRIALEILRKFGIVDIQDMDVDIKFPRRYGDNIATKVTALQGLIAAGVSPEIAYATVSLWNDPSDVWMQSKKYAEEKAEKQEEQIEREAETQDGTEDTADQEDDTDSERI